MQKKLEKYESDGSDSDEAENSNEDEEQMETDQDENASGDEEEADEEAGPSGSADGEKSEKKKKRGIIYLSSIPKYMNVTILREMLSEYAKIGRIFLQPGKLSRKFDVH